jgi:hypothetical protein
MPDKSPTIDEQFAWNSAIEAAMREVVMQSLAIPPHAYPEDYARACRDCARRLALLKEPHPTPEQVAGVMIGLIAGAMLPDYLERK